MSTEARVTTLELAMTELAVAQARTQANLDRLAERSEREMAELRRQQGELSNKFGTLVEDIVFPGIPEVFRRIFGQEKRPECALRVTRRHVRDPGRMQEFDAIAEGDGIFLINETKSRVRAEDVSAFALLLSETVSFFPHAEGKRIVGALASFHIDPSVVRAGEREGLLMLGLSSGLMEILNSPDFTPKAF